MPSPRAWLADVVLLNESRSEVSPGAMSVFRSSEEACSWLEPWWVEQGEGFAFTAVGERLTLGVVGNRVIITARDPIPEGQERVRSWLHASASAVLETRKGKARKGKAFLGEAEERGELPTSIEGLIAYIGFEH